LNTGPAITLRGDDLEIAAVIMDWYGVIGDREETSKKYRTVYASLLRSRYGGSFGRWVKAHDLAFEWYITEWQRLYEKHRNGSAFEKDLEAKTVKMAFKEVGLHIENGEAFRISTELEYDIASQLGSVYPDVAPSLEKIKEMPIDLYIASNVSSDHLKGLLESSGLKDTFLKRLTPDEMGARKSDEAFWKEAFNELGLPPDGCLVVDDASASLKRAKDSGAATVCLQRKAPHKPCAIEGFKPDFTISSLDELPRIVKKELGSKD
jgi:HAD superfamily hydrolase (TIGR01509 family)